MSILLEVSLVAVFQLLRVFAFEPSCHLGLHMWGIHIIQGSGRRADPKPSTLKGLGLRV